MKHVLAKSSQLKRAVRSAEPDFREALFLIGLNLSRKALEKGPPHFDNFRRTTGDIAVVVKVEANLKFLDANTDIPIGSFNFGKKISGLLRIKAINFAFSKI